MVVIAYEKSYLNWNSRGSSKTQLELKWNSNGTQMGLKWDSNGTQMGLKSQLTQIQMLLFSSW
jgi:hypothetical protein